MNIKPIISVVLPVYNGEKYLKESVESVLNQTFVNFELIIINDGSTDNSLSIIQGFMNDDNRIKLINRENKGLVASLNEGISVAKGNFIARMDVDDICFPTRFEEQLNYMEAYNIDLCGSWVQKLNGSKYSGINRYPLKHEDIVISLIFYNPFAHPSTMIRSKVFETLSYKNEIAEDYSLWCDIIICGYKVANLPKVLLKYRQHEQQITKNKTNELSISAKNISERFANKLGLLESEAAKNKALFINCKERKRYSGLAKNLDQLVKKHKASTEIKFDILLWLYLSAQPKTPYLYYQYRRSTSGYEKNLQNEVILFLKSFLYLQPESALLGVLRKGVRNTFIR